MKEMELEFARTVREHKGTIYTVCYMFSNNPDEVADLYQEILINLWKGFPKFRGDSNVRTWIYRVSLNTCISSDRKKQRRVDILPLTLHICESVFRKSLIENVEVFLSEGCLLRTYINMVMHIADFT